jgi:diguanylate cyclase
VLRSIAECLSTRMRCTDFLARYRGEEFALILPGTKLDDATPVIDEMRIAISSIGFHFRARRPRSRIQRRDRVLADSAGSVFHRADKALYLAKERGRNRCVSL